MLIVPRWLGALVVLGLTFWWALGLAVAGPGGDSLRLALAAIYALAGLAAVVGLVLERGWRPALAVYGVALLAVLGWWLSLRPSNERAWTPEVARLAHATIQGDLVTVHDIRNFDYRSETDFTPAYYDRTFDVRKLDTLDLLPVYWMGPAIAHMLVSFGFGDDHLAVSIEARKVEGESYSSLKGFFRQYELVYVVADERDVMSSASDNWSKPGASQQQIGRDTGAFGKSTENCCAAASAVSARSSNPTATRTSDLFIRAVVFSCTPADSAACQATQECGSAGNCVRHPNPVEPVAFNIQNLRSATWWGWTTTPAEATLHFEVIVGP